MASIHDAALMGDCGEIRDALARGESPNELQDGDCPLQKAVLYDHREAVVLLIASGARVDAPDSGGLTALHTAALYGHAALIGTLAQAGAPLGARGPDGGTALHTAAFYGQRACCEALLAAGADALAQDGGGGTPLHSAAGAGHAEVIRALLASARPRPGTGAGGALAALAALRDALDAAGEAAVHRAAWADKHEAVRALVDAGAPIEHRSAGANATPLARAAASGSVDSLTWLLSAGADASARDVDGATALHAAAAAGSGRCVAALLAAPRVSPSAHAADGTTPLHAAARGVHMAVAEALLAGGADACAQDGRRQRPADVAGSEEMTALLVRSAAAQQAFLAGSPLPGVASVQPQLSAFVPPPPPPEAQRAPSSPRAPPPVRVSATAAVPRRVSLSAQVSASDDVATRADDAPSELSPPPSPSREAEVRAEAKARAAAMVAQAAARAAANVASRTAAAAPQQERGWAGRVRVPPGAAAVLGSRPGSPSRGAPASAAFLRAATSAVATSAVAPRAAALFPSTSAQAPTPTLAVASPEVMRARDALATAVAAAAAARAAAEAAAHAAADERARVSAASAARSAAAAEANRAAEAAQRAAAAEALAAAAEAAAAQRADAAEAAQRSAEAAVAAAAERVASADLALRAAAVEASAAAAEAARARREREIAATTAAAADEALRLRAAADAASAAESVAAAAEAKARAAAADAERAAAAAQTAAEGATGDDVEMAHMEAHMAAEEARLSSMRAQMAEKQRDAASRRAQRAADEAAAAEAALERARSAAASLAAESPPASPAKGKQAQPPAASVVAPPQQQPQPQPVVPRAQPPPPPPPPTPVPVALAEAEASLEVQHVAAAPSPSPEPEQAAPPAPLSEAADAQFAAEAAARAAAIAEAEATYHNALSVAELLEIQAAETEELRREDSEASHYMGGEEVRAAQQAAESARRRAASAAIRTAQAKLAALRRSDADAAAAHAARGGTLPSHVAAAMAEAARADAGSVYGEAASPRWPGASPKRSAYGQGGAAAVAAPAAVPYYVPVDTPYDEEEAAPPDAQTAAELAAVSRRAHTLRAGVDPYTPLGEASDAIRYAMERASLGDEQEAPIPGMPGLPAAAAAPYQEGLVEGEEEEGRYGAEQYVNEQYDDSAGNGDERSDAANEVDPYMAQEEMHRQEMRETATRAAAARAMAAEAESYLQAGPGSRPVDADKAWRLAARLAGGGVDDKMLPPALAGCTAALLGAPSAARAGAWGLHEAVAQAAPKELFYLHGNELLAPLNATVAALLRDRAAADWFAAHFAAASLRVLTEGDLSAKYWIEGELSENDNLAEADVFFDPGPHGKFELPDDDDLDDAMRRRMEPPEAGRECLLLVKGDRELEALVRAAAAVQPRLGSRGSTPAGVRARLSALAQWLCTRCGGPGNADRVAKAEKQAALLAARGGPLGLVPLARVTQGLARHRAILFKYLTDKLFAEDAVRCRLVRAPRAIAPQGAHVWNVVILAEPDEAGEERDVHLLVDLMAERLHGSLEPRLVDERGAYATEYKATAGFTAYRLEKPPPQPPRHAAELQRVRALPAGTFGGSFVARRRGGGVAHSGADAAGGDALYCAKEFAPVVTGSPVEAALLELPALKACRHPNVVAVRALLPQNEMWYLLTNLHPAGSWDGALKAQPADATQRGELLLRFALETACGMAYLHARRIAHCDLKPTNLLVTSGGGVAVTDYGLSHLLPPAEQAARVAHWSGAYMAPEARLVMSGGVGGELTPAADVWSFGVCVGQALLHGEYPAQLPAPGSAAAMAPGASSTMPYNDAAIAAAEAPRALAAVYRACLSRQPAQRPRFDALVEELERASKAFCAGQRDG